MSRPEPHTFQFGVFRLIPAEGLLLREGQPVAIPPKALELLVVLVRRRGHVVSKAELLEAVWPDTVVEEANLTQNISTLRKALDDSGGPSCIETYPKRGYRFAAPVEEPVAEETPVSDAPPPRAGSPTARAPAASYRGRVAFAGVVVVAAVVGGIALRERLRPPAVAGERVMLAVLPFQNLSGDAEQEFISDGLTEETIARLGGLNPERLGVIARTSVMSYKDTDRSVAEIGAELGVDFILEGSIRRGGADVRVTAQLVRTSDQTHLWAQSFEGDWTGVLEFQKETAERIAQTLAVELIPGEPGDRIVRASSDPRAYEAYLMGRYFWNKRTREGFERSEELFEEALTLDPGFALAHSGLADTYMLRRNYGWATAEDALPRVERSAGRAIELDPTLAEPHATLTAVRMAEDDYEGARRELLRAIELDPNYATARQWYAGFLGSIGRPHEGVVQIDLALELDPLSLRANVDKARLLYFAGRYDEAVEQCRRTLEMDPEFAPTRFQLGLTLLEQGHHEAAITELETAARDGASMWLGYGYGRAGREAEAREMLSRLRAIWETEGTRPAALALVYTGLGELDLAFEWLEIAFEHQDPDLNALKAWPYWEPLRGDHRYDDLVRRMNLPL